MLHSIIHSHIKWWRECEKICDKCYIMSWMQEVYWRSHCCVLAQNPLSSIILTASLTQHRPNLKSCSQKKSLLTDWSSKILKILALVENEKTLKLLQIKPQMEKIPRCDCRSINTITAPWGGRAAGHWAQLLLTHALFWTVLKGLAGVNNILTLCVCWSYFSVLRGRVACDKREELSPQVAVD